MQTEPHAIYRKGEPRQAIRANADEAIQPLDRDLEANDTRNKATSLIGPAVERVKSANC